MIKSIFLLLAFSLFLSCGNTSDEKKNKTSERQETVQDIKAIDSSFSEENASELATILKENNSTDSVNIVEEVKLKSTK